MRTGVMCAWEEYPDGRLWHTARSEEEVNRFLNACLSRINYGSLSWVNLHVVDELGLHTKLLEFLLANDCKAEFLDLTFNGPLALKFLKRQIERGAIEELNICGEWPQKVVKKLLKLIPQPQFHELHTYGNSPLTVKYRDLLKVIEKSTTNGSKSPKKLISMRNGVLEDFPMEQTPAKSSLGVKHDYFYVEFHVWR
ncbi:hypothetical protein L596_028480 [Steinernema carpocapsae]|uniref:Uncharacterized protein n=1 Tax=Steinernema carpocapsae TaxID=34508 RepID=A0A4U5LYN8_STECR|nr:hypothetical protein L596_028480 [Steinernema carpocapsae]